MMTTLLLAVVFLFGINNPTQKIEDERVLVADVLYWTGPEGNLGIEISGKFQSEQGLKDVLSLSTEIGLLKDRKYPFNVKTWTLRDVLVSANFNANGSVATWQVSGPRPLLESYLDGLKRVYEDKSMFYDFGYRFIDFKVSTD
jgi:hypothetical protein